MPETATVRCQSCQATYEVDGSAAGTIQECPKCGAVSRIPEAASDPEQQTEYADAVRKCPSCSKSAAASAVLCVNCGFDFRTGTQHTTSTSNEPSQPSEGAKRKKSSRKSTDHTRMTNALFGLAICACALGGFVFGCRWVYSKIQTSIHHSQINDILKPDSPSPQALSREAPYLVSYCQRIQAEQSRLATARRAKLTELIPRLPAETDMDSLVFVPDDSFAYEPFLTLARKHCDLEWRLNASCHRSASVRGIGAELLGHTLFALSLDDATKARLKERTSLKKKQSLFETLREECHAKAKESFCGRFRMHLEAGYVPGLVDGRSPKYSRADCTTQNAVLGVSCVDKDQWRIQFFGKQWQGPVEDIASIDIPVPVAEIGDALGEFALLLRTGGAGLRITSYGGNTSSNLRNADIHLRLENGSFSVAPNPMPQFHHAASDSDKSEFQPGFTSFRTEFLKVE